MNLKLVPCANFCLIQKQDNSRWRLETQPSATVYPPLGFKITRTFGNQWSRDLIWVEEWCKVPFRCRQTYCSYIGDVESVVYTLIFKREHKCWAALNLCIQAILIKTLNPPCSPTCLQCSHSTILPVELSLRFTRHQPFYGPVLYTPQHRLPEDFTATCVFEYFITCPLSYASRPVFVLHWGGSMASGHLSSSQFSALHGSFILTSPSRTYRGKS